MHYATRDLYPVTLFHVVCTCGNNQLDVRTRLRWDSLGLGSITLDWRKKNAREEKWTDKKTFVCYRLHYSKRSTLFFLLDHSFTSLWKPCWGWESSSCPHGSSLGGPSSNAVWPMEWLLLINNSFIIIIINLNREFKMIIKNI